MLVTGTETVTGEQAIMGYLDTNYPEPLDWVAAAHNVSLRTGCFCNAGAGEIAFAIAREMLVGGEFGDGNVAP